MAYPSHRAGYRLDRRCGARRSGIKAQDSGRVAASLAHATWFDHSGEAYWRAHSTRGLASPCVEPVLNTPAESLRVRTQHQDPGSGFFELLRYLQETDPETAAKVNRLVTSAWTEDSLERPWPEPIPLKPPEPEQILSAVLPGSLRAHVASVAAATQTPEGLGVLLGLAAASAAIGGKVEVMADRRRRWREVTSIYAAAILPPGSRKSPVYEAFEAPIRAWEADTQRRASQDRRTALDRVDVLNGRLQSAIQAAAKANDAHAMAEVEEARQRLEEAESAAPALPRLLASDATPEALVRLMAEQGGRAALMAPEGDPFRIMDGRYSRGGEARLDELKRAWSGESIRVDRVGRDSIHVPRPALTLAVCMQPSVLRTLANARSFRGEGVFARMLWVLPNPGIGRRLTGRQVPDFNYEAAARYARTLRRLLAAPAAGRDDDGQLLPHILELSADGTEVLYEYEEEIETKVAPDGELSGIADWALKACGQAVRIAAILELWARAEKGGALWDDPISATAMRGGVALLRSFESHALSVLDKTGADEELELARYVWRRLRELGDRTTVRNLWQATRGKKEIRSVKELEGILGTLEQHHLIRCLDRPSEGPGRPPSPWVRLHPDFRVDHRRSIPTIPRKRASEEETADCGDTGNKQCRFESFDVPIPGEGDV